MPRDLGRFQLKPYVPYAGARIGHRGGQMIIKSRIARDPHAEGNVPFNYLNYGDSEAQNILSDLYPLNLDNYGKSEQGLPSLVNKDFVDTIARINTGKPTLGTVNPFLGGPKVVGGLNPYLGGPKILGGGKPTFESPFPVLPSGPRKPVESLFGKKPKKLSPEEMRFLLQLKTHRFNKETGQYEPREQDRGAIGGQTVFGIDVQPTLKNKLFNRKLTKLAAQLGHTYGEPASDLIGDVVQRYRARDPYSVLGVSPWSGEDLAKSLRAQLGGTVKLPSGESQAVDPQIMRWFQDKLGAEPITPNSVGERSWDWMVDRLFRGQQN